MKNKKHLTCFAVTIIAQWFHHCTVYMNISFDIQPTLCVMCLSGENTSRSCTCPSMNWTWSCYKPPECRHSHLKPCHYRFGGTWRSALHSLCVSVSVPFSPPLFTFSSSFSHGPSSSFCSVIIHFLSLLVANC